MTRRGKDLRPRKIGGHEANSLRRTAALLLAKVAGWDAELVAALRDPAYSANVARVEAIMQRRGELMMVVDILRAVMEGRGE